MGIDVPLIGDFHYNGHRLLTDYPACAEALSKYRINPGNVGKGDKRDVQFGQMIEAAMRYNKAIRIGVNWGSLDQELLAELMDANSLRAQPWESRQVMYEALISSAISSAQRAEAMGLDGAQIALVLQSLGRARFDFGLPRVSSPHRLRLAFGLDRSRHGNQRHRGLGDGVVHVFCKRALATPSGSRSHPNPASPARKKW